jgi:hypothetical protein
MLVVEPDVPPIVVVEELAVHGLPAAENVGIGDVIIGLTPALFSSAEPSGMPLPDTAPVADPLIDDVEVKVDAVPAELPEPHDPWITVVPEFIPYNGIAEFVVLRFMSVASKVDLDPVPGTADALVPALKHGVVLAVGLSGAIPRPPGESAFAPCWVPTGPAPIVAPGTPRGDVVPIAGAAGAIDICAKPSLPLKRTKVAHMNAVRIVVSLFKVGFDVQNERLEPLLDPAARRGAPTRRVVPTQKLARCARSNSASSKIRIRWNSSMKLTLEAFA